MQEQEQTLEDKIIKIELTVKHVNTVLNHLAKGTYSEVAEVVAIIKTQGDEQVLKKEEPDLNKE
jgi:hypothetical protein